MTTSEPHSAIESGSESVRYTKRLKLEQYLSQLDDDDKDCDYSVVQSTVYATLDTLMNEHRKKQGILVLSLTQNYNICHR